MSFVRSSNSHIEHRIIRAAAIGSHAPHTLPNEPMNLAIEGDDLLAAAAQQSMEFLLRHLTDQQRATMGLVLGTTLGCLEADREFDRSRRPADGRYASPAAFRRTLPSTTAAEIALKFGILGPSLVLCAGDCSAALAMRRALSWMNHMGLDLCAAGAMDLTGPRTGLPEGCRVAMLLLARTGNDPIGEIQLGPWKQPDLAAPWDISLDRLISWTAEPRTVDLGAGIELFKIRTDSPASGQ